MKSFAKSLVIGLGLSAAGLAYAQEESQSERYDPTYSSIRIGSLESDFDNLDRAINLGFTLGIRIKPLPFLSAEIDLGSTLIPGDNQGQSGGGLGGGGGDDGGGLGGLLGGDGGDGGDGGGSSSSRNETQDGDDLRANTVGVFFTASTPRQYSDFYLKGRAGYRFVQTTIDEINEEETGSAFGGGIGYRYGEFGAVELSYTQYGSDLSLLELVFTY